MALEIEWNCKKAYARIEGINIRKNRMPAGMRGSNGSGPDPEKMRYGHDILYTIYEDSTAATALSHGEYLLDFDAESTLAVLPLAYSSLKKLKEFEGAKDI
jgi:hypothetical protein